MVFFMGKSLVILWFTTFGGNVSDSELFLEIVFTVQVIIAKIGWSC